MELGDKVVLKTFRGSLKPNTQVVDAENYWTLIGESGQVIQDPNESGVYASFSREKRLLVQFNCDIKTKNLECHNSVENSLWILESDLKRV